MINKAITFIIISIVAFYMFYYSFMSVGHTDVALENITFALNNTDYDLAHPITNNDLILYFFNNVTYPIPTANYLATTTTVKVYTNGTLAYPNITNGSTTFYYATYSYYQPFTVWGSSYLFIFGLILLIVGFVIVLKLSKFGFSKK